MNRIIISIDLGLTGFITVLDHNEEKRTLLEYYKIQTDLKPNELSTKQSKYFIKSEASFIKNNLIIKEILETYSENNAVIIFEQISTRVGFSASSAMSLADTQATFRAIANSNDVPYYQIAPSKWKKKLKISKEKIDSQNLLNNLIINKDIIVVDKVLKNHNFVESLLIAYYYSIL